MVSKLNSQSKGCVFESRLMDMGLKPCQGRFRHPIPVHFEKKEKNTGLQMGQTDKKKIFFKCLQTCFSEIRISQQKISQKTAFTDKGTEYPGT